MRSRSFVASFSPPALLVACGTAFGWAASACGSAGEPPSALPTGGTSSGGSSSGGAGRAGASGAGNAGAPSSAGSGGEEPAPNPNDCNPQIFESPPTSAIHQTQCTEITYSTTPPSGGDHYGIWSQFQSYDYPVPPGFLVHNLEHGAVIFWYDCPDGCDDEVDEVQAFIDSQPEDPLCAGFAAARRAILVPYPGLGARWAASAWGYALLAECFDSAAFGDFYADHYGNAPESLCNDGQVIPEDACP
jgi:hypothetical protein